MVKFSQQPCWIWIGTKIQISLICRIVKWFYDSRRFTFTLFHNSSNQLKVLEKYQKLTANCSCCKVRSSCTPINSITTTTLRHRDSGSIYCLSTGYYETIKKGFSTCCAITTTCNRLQRQLSIVLYLIIQWCLMLDIAVFMPETAKIISKLISICH